MATLILIIIIISSIVGFGIHLCMKPGMILHFYKNFLDKFETARTIPRIGLIIATLRGKRNDYILHNNYHKCFKYSYFLHYLVKPLGLCVVCNTAWISILISFLFIPITLSAIFYYIIIILGSTGLVGLISKLYYVYD